MNSKIPNLNNKVLRGLLAAGVLALSLIVLSGCSAHGSHRQRYVEPGVNASFEYYYYPEQHVYYDRHRHIYHYHHHRHGWLAVRKLPPHIHLNHRSRHPLAFRHNRPWNERHAHKRHHSHQDDRRQQEPRENRHDYQYEKSPPPREQPNNGRNKNHNQHDSRREQPHQGRDEKQDIRQKQLGHEQRQQDKPRVRQEKKDDKRPQREASPRELKDKTHDKPIKKTDRNQVPEENQTEHDRYKQEREKYIDRSNQ